MFNEPVLGLLPATESEILSVNTRVSPDSVLRRIRRLERFGAIKRNHDGKYTKVEPVEVKPEKTCRRCKMLFDADELVGSRCPECREKDNREQRERRAKVRSTYRKVCPSCLNEYVGQMNFKETRGGRLFSRCNKCRAEATAERARKMALLVGK